jgi:hypothetical protein
MRHLTSIQTAVVTTINIQIHGSITDLVECLLNVNKLDSATRRSRLKCVESRRLQPQLSWYSQPIYDFAKFHFEIVLYGSVRYSREVLHQRSAIA